MKVLNLGSLNIDRIYQVEHFVEPKETIKADVYKELCGGKGLNQSIALAKAGADVYHAGCIGQDGEMLISILKEHGVKTDYVRRSQKPSGHAVIQVNREGQNNIIICGGANDDVTESYIDEVLTGFSKEDMILLQNEISNVDYAIRKARERGMKIVVNPSPINQALETYELQEVDYFILNEVEGKYLSGKESDSPVEMMEELKVKFPQAAFVLTLGENGAYYFDAKSCVFQKRYQVEAVDTTGAGDTFSGYFLAGIMQGRGIEESLRSAGMAAALAVSRHGAAPSIPELQEVNAILKEEKKYGKDNFGC